MEKGGTELQDAKATFRRRTGYLDGSNNKKKWAEKTGQEPEGAALSGFFDWSKHIGKLEEGESFRQGLGRVRDMIRRSQSQGRSVRKVGGV